MRFLELRADDVAPPLRLHPRLTFVRGLDPAARVALVGFVHSVATGESFGWRGVVEVHGVRMELDRALELIGPTAEAAQIIEASTLIDAATRGASGASDEAAAHAESLAACEQLEREAADLAEELSGAGRVRAEMTARLKGARERLDPACGPRLDRADGELGRAARRADRPDPWTGTSDPDQRIAHLETLIEGLDQELAQLPSGDRASLAAAVGTARAAVSPAEVVPCPEASALAEAWVSLHQRLSGLESRIEATGGGTEAVAARLDSARAAARAAEDAAVPRAVQEAESQHLEELHDEVLETEARAGRSIRRGAARREFEAAQKALNDALDEIGYPTWAAFRMGNGLASVSQAKLDEYERSRSELEAAEIEWAELMARLERDTDLQSVLNAIDAALDHGIALLGEDPYSGDDDDPELLVAALRARTVAAASISVDRDDAIAHLRGVLTEAGCFGHAEVNSDAGLIALGDTWLRVLEAADEAAVRILRDRERAAAELKELILLGAGSRVDRLGVEREAVHEAEAAVAEHRGALLDVSRVRLELHMLLATELAVAEEHDAKLELLEGARVLERIARHRLDNLVGGPTGIDAVAASIPRGLGGAIPLVVLMGDAPMEALDDVLDLPIDLQIVVVGDTAEMVAWAARLPAGSVEVIERSALV